jgi:uncharacterized membrane protein
MFEKFKKLDVILLLSVIIALNSIREINIAQSIVAVGIFALLGYYKWLEKTTSPDIAQEVRDEVSTLRTMISGIVIKNTIKPQQNSQEFKRLF